MGAIHGPLVRDPEAGDRRHEWGTLGENALDLDEADAAAVVDALAVDFAGSFNLFYLLRKHYWLAEGAEHDDAAAVLKTAAERTEAVNDAIAVRVVELGGLPPTTPATIQARAEVHLEAEDVYDLATALTGDLEGYDTLLRSVRDHVALAETRGDRGTGAQLRAHLRTLEADAEGLRRLVAADTLVGEPRREAQ